MRFRIYALGNLEVRTLQELDSHEVVGAVFSTQPLSKSADPEVAINERERVKKATLYVERAGSLKAASGNRRYFVVLETAEAHKVLMELLSTGEATWEPQPTDLQDRCSLAKVLVSAGCKMGLLVGDMKAYQTTLIQSDSTTSILCKRHA